MTDLTQGANTGVAASSVKVALSWPADAGTLDGSAYLLTATGKVRDDDDMIFYNQPKGADGAISVVSHGQGGITFELDLTRMPAVIERVVFCLTVDAGQGARRWRPSAGRAWS